MSIADETGHRLTSLPRVYQKTPGTIHDPVQLVGVLSRKPRAWGASILRPDVPQPLRDALDAAQKDERVRLLRLLAEASRGEGFIAAAQAMARLVSAGRSPQHAETIMLAKRLAQADTPLDARVDLSVYDQLTSRRRGRPPVPGPAPTVEQIMAQAKSLPLTKHVLQHTLEHATAVQRRFLSGYLDAENTSRDTAKRLRLTRQARFPATKTLHGYDWSNIAWPPDWGRADLTSLTFIDRAEDLVFYGDVGTGKPHLAIAVGLAACQAQIPTRFHTTASLISRLRTARDTGRLGKALDRIAKTRLLICDELGYLPIDTDGARLLFQVIATAYKHTSIIFTSNLEFSRWGSVLGDDQMAAAIIDRIVHHGRMLTFKGDSYRLTHATMK